MCRGRSFKRQNASQSKAVRFLVVFFAETFLFQCTVAFLLLPTSLVRETLKLWFYCFHEVRAGKVRAGNGKRVVFVFSDFPNHRYSNFISVGSLLYLLFSRLYIASANSAVAHSKRYSLKKEIAESNKVKSAPKKYHTKRFLLKAI